MFPSWTNVVILTPVTIITIIATTSLLLTIFLQIWHSLTLLTSITTSLRNLPLFHWWQKPQLSPPLTLMTKVLGNFVHLLPLGLYCLPLLICFISLTLICWQSLFLTLHRLIQKKILFIMLSILMREVFFLDLCQYSPFDCVDSPVISLNFPCIVSSFCSPDLNVYMFLLFFFTTPLCVLLCFAKFLALMKLE